MLDIYLHIIIICDTRNIVHIFTNSVSYVKYLHIYSVYSPWDQLVLPIYPMMAN